MTFISAKMANVENFGWRWWQRCYEISRDAVREISRLSASIPVDRRFVRLFSLSLSIPLFFSLGSLVILGIYFFARRSPTRRLVGCAHNEITARVSCAKTRFYAQLLGRGQEYPRKIIPSSVILTHTRLKIVWLTSDDGTRVRERERERLFGYASNNPKQPCSLILHGFTKSVETTVSRFFFFLSFSF